MVPTASRLSPWKKCLLTAYFYATLPTRRRALERLAARREAPVMVLFYHRVADHTPNGWTISNRSFARQIDWLQRNLDLVSLSEAQRRIREGNHRPAVSITFDDGYAENCEQALPLLIRQRIPCTYFVANHFVMTGEAFPQDVAAGRPLAPNTLEQLRHLAEAGVEIGGHTRTHANLGRITDDGQLWDEVVTARDELAAAVGCDIRYFAFPYGLHQHLNVSVFRWAPAVGLAGICSAYGGYNLPGDDALHLQRIHGDPDFVRLKNWLTVDPRKMRALPRFDYLAADGSHAQPRVESSSLPAGAF